MEYNTKKIINERGVSLIITFFIMLIIIVIVLVVSTLLYSQIKVIRNIGDSVISFYAADSGIEKVLFYDRQVIPDVEGVSRGLCSMFDQEVNDGKECAQDPNPADANSDHSIFCNATSKDVIDQINYADGCDADKCNSCEINFGTNISSNKNYVVKAKVSPGLDGESIDFIVDSSGLYENVKRAVNLFITKAISRQIIEIVYATATPRSVENGVAVDIEVRAKSINGISQIFAHIKDSYDSTTWTEAALTCDNNDIKDRTCSGGTIMAPGDYYVDVRVIDMSDIELIQKNIPPYFY